MGLFYNNNSNLWSVLPEFSQNVGKSKFNSKRPNFWSEEDGSCSCPLQSGQRSCEVKWLPTRACSASRPQSQSLRADFASREGKICQHGHPHSRKGWWLHLSSVCNPSSNRKRHRC